MLATKLPRPTIRRAGNSQLLGWKVYSTATRDSSSSSTVINIPTSNIYNFGDANSAMPIFRDINWTAKEGEAWAVIGSGSGDKGALFQTLLGHLRISPPPPPPGGLFPFLTVPNPSMDPYTRLAIVSFGHRRRATGEFYDYTARYGAVRDEDRVTLRQSMFPQYIKEMKPSPFSKEDRMKEQQAVEEIPLTEKERRFFGELVDKMGLEKLLDLPLIALSNGQTRRARIVKAILRKPELLLLDEPLTGLDAPSRPRLLSLLHSLHTSHAPRVILGLRTQDAIPEWITHVALVLGGARVRTGLKQAVLEETKVYGSNVHAIYPDPGEKISESEEKKKNEEPGVVLVDMKDVSVKYGPRTVLDNINWQIRQGERWHLQGANGSGKTTLTSLLTGDHPQSYVQSHLHLPCLSPSSQPHHPHRTLYTTQHRKRIPTPHLQRLIGVVSPELFDAFPRRHPGMSVWEAVGTGFDGGFVPKGKDGVGAVEEQILDQEEQKRAREWRVERCWEVLEALGPGAWAGPQDDTRTKSEIAASFAQKRFSALSVGEQRIVLLMRALVGRPPVVLLDEVWSGMNEGMVRAAQAYLRQEPEGQGRGVTREQAIVVITHWEEEVPWGVEDGVRRFRLEGGVGKILE